MQHIEERSEWFNIFGEGADAFQRGVAKHFETDEDQHLVEVDWLDLFGSYGIIFTSLIHIFVLLPFFVSTYRFSAKREPLAGLLACALCLVIICWTFGACQPCTGEPDSLDIDGRLLSSVF